MLAKRKLNNNAVLCIDSAGSEMIAMGKGVGFGTLPREISPAEIERTFYNISPADQNVMQDLPADVVLFAAKIIDIASNELPYPLSSNAPLLLADHINFAMERVRKRLKVQMPLAYDVQQMYRGNTASASTPWSVSGRSFRSVCQRKKPLASR